MEEGDSNKGLWAGLIIAVVVAVIFLVLWFMRGGEIDTLQNELRSAQNSHSSEVMRLESDIRSAKSESDSNARRLADAESEQRRIADAAAAQERRLRDDVASADRRVADIRSELAQAREELDAAATAASEAEGLRSELAQARREAETHAAALADFRRDADARIADLTEESARLAAMSTLSNGEARDMDEALEAYGARMAEAAREREAELQSRVDELSSRLESEGDRVEKLWQNRLAELERDAADAREELTSTRAEHQRLADQLRDTGAATREWQERIAALEAQLAEAKSQLATAGTEGERRLQDRERQLAESFQTRERELTESFDARAREQAKSFQAREQELTESYQANEREIRNRLAELSQERDQLSASLKVAEQAVTAKHQESETLAAQAKQEFAAQTLKLTREVDAAKTAEGQARQELSRAQASAETLRAESAVRVEAVTREADAKAREAEARALEAANKTREAEDRLAAARDELAAQSRKFAAEADKLNEQVDALRETIRTSVGEHSLGLHPTGRSVSRIVQLMPDGQTCMIAGGVLQRMKPGMKFDVYRPAGDRNRYVGMLKIIRVMEEFSLALPVPAEARAQMCPVTALSVMDPGAKYSPYVTEKDGSAVRLVDGGPVSFPMECPEVGDLLENPFYDTERSVFFTLAPGTPDAYEIGQIVSALSGELKQTTIGTIDYEVVPDASWAEAVAPGAHRRVSKAMLEKYIVSLCP